MGMQRGLEVDIRRGSGGSAANVCVLWLTEDSSGLCVGATKQSIATQELALRGAKIAAVDCDELNLSGHTTISIESGKQKVTFNVDTETSRDILVRNLLRVVNAQNMILSEHGKTTGFHTTSDTIGIAALSIGSILSLIGVILWYSDSYHYHPWMNIGIWAGVCCCLVVLVFQVFEAVANGRHRYTELPMDNTKKRWQTSSQESITHSAAP